MMIERLSQSGGATIERAYPVERRQAFMRNATLKITLTAKEYNIAPVTRDGIIDHLQTQLVDTADTVRISAVEDAQSETPALEVVANAILKEYIFSHYDAIARENKGNLGLHAFISSVVTGLEEGWWKNISKKA